MVSYCLYDMYMKKIIVTGAAGFFGINLIKSLLRKEYKVTAVLRPQSAHNRRVEELVGDNLNIICLDMKEIAELPVILDGHDKAREPYDTFFHIAWQGGRNNAREQAENIPEALEALEAAKALGCKRFICSGSQAEYGAADGLITEETPLKPFSAYGAAKTAASQLTRIRAEQLGIEWVWGRIFSLIGRYEPGGRMLPDLVERLKNKEDIVLSSCRQNWDYLDAEDAAEAFIALAGKGRNGEIYNVASGDYHSLSYFVEKTKTIFDSEAKITYGEDPDPFVTLSPSIEKLRMDTGWEPKVPFEESLKKYD